MSPIHLQHHVRRPSRGHLAPLAMIILAGLPIALPAEEAPQIEHKVVRRPVVVVRSGEHQPVYTWSSVGTRSFLGVQTVGMTAELRQHFGVPDDAGVLVSKVVDESPAAIAGIQVGDVLTAIDSETVESPAALARAIGERESGETVLIEVWRDESVQSISAVLSEREGPWVDIRQFGGLGPEDIEMFAWNDEDFGEAIQIESETFKKAIERLNQELSSPEWHERVHQFQQHQSELMERLEELEQRLHELEGELEELPGKDRR